MISNVTKNEVLEFLKCIEFLNKKFLPEEENDVYVDIETIEDNKNDTNYNLLYGKYVGSSDKKSIVGNIIDAEKKELFKDIIIKHDKYIMSNIKSRTPFKIEKENFNATYYYNEENNMYTIIIEVSNNDDDKWKMIFPFIMEKKVDDKIETLSYHEELTSKKNYNNDKSLLSKYHININKIDVNQCKEINIMNYTGRDKSIYKNIKKHLRNEQIKNIGFVHEWFFIMSGELLLSSSNSVSFFKYRLKYMDKYIKCKKINSNRKNTLYLCWSYVLHPELGILFTRTSNDSEIYELLRYARSHYSSNRHLSQIIDDLGEKIYEVLNTYWNKKDIKDATSLVNKMIFN